MERSTACLKRAYISLCHLRSSGGVPEEQWDIDHSFVNSRGRDLRCLNNISFSVYRASRHPGTYVTPQKLPPGGTAKEHYMETNLFNYPMLNVHSNAYSLQEMLTQNSRTINQRLTLSRQPKQSKPAACAERTNLAVKLVVLSLEPPRFHCLLRSTSFHYAAAGTG